MGKKKILTVAELVSKAGKAGGRARAKALSPERRSEIAAMGGEAGGRARAEALSPTKRKAIAAKAAKARWGNKSAKSD